MSDISAILNGRNGNKETVRSEDEVASAKPQIVDHEARARARVAEISAIHGDDDFSEVYVDKWFAEAPPGWIYEWKTHSVWNKEYPQYVAATQRNGWSPVPCRVRHRLYPEYEGENTIIDGMILMERPKEINDRVNRRLRTTREMPFETVSGNSRIRRAALRRAPRSPTPCQRCGATLGRSPSAIDINRRSALTIALRRNLFRLANAVALSGPRTIQAHQRRSLDGDLPTLTGEVRHGELVCALWLRRIPPPRRRAQLSARRRTALDSRHQRQSDLFRRPGHPAVVGLCRPSDARPPPQVCGIFAGCEYVSKAAKKIIWSPWWPGITSDAVSGGQGFDVVAKVIDDPLVVFRVQANGQLAGRPNRHERHLHLRTAHAARRPVPRRTR